MKIELDTKNRELIVDLGHKTIVIPETTEEGESVAYELVSTLGTECNILWGELELSIREYDRNLTIGGKAYFQTIEEAIESTMYWRYDSGYGSQQLFGEIVLTDNSWYSRSEYDGSESWEHNSVPETPEWAKAKLKLKEQE